MTHLGHERPILLRYKAPFSLYDVLGCVPRPTGRKPVRRRDFITLVGGAATAWPLAARAQQPSQIRRIGVLFGASEVDSEVQRSLQAFLQGLQDLGWKPSTNLQVD